MKLSPSGLLPPRHACYYLYGEDRDALFESADALLAGEAGAVTMLRVDIGEIDRVQVESRSQGLFGATRCHALVRNAESATPKQTDQLLAFVNALPEGTRLIVCAAGIEYRKALHKKMVAYRAVASCEFPRPTPARFQAWLDAQLEDAGLRLSEEAKALLADHLDGLRLAARQAVERLQLYDNGIGEELGVDVVGDLVGERSPDELPDLCHAMAMREPRALSLLHRLMHDQQVAEVQILSWLQTRFQGLLLYCWHIQDDARTATRRAGLFGEAQKLVPQEARCWSPSALMRALTLIVDAEMKLKGSSVEPKPVVMERLALHLLAL